MVSQKAAGELPRFDFVLREALERRVASTVVVSAVGAACFNVFLRLVTCGELGLFRGAGFGVVSGLQVVVGVALTFDGIAGCEVPARR